MSSQAPIRKSFLWTLLVVNLIALPALFFLSKQNHVRSAVPLPDYGKLEQGFTFTEKSGKEVSLDSLKGRIYIADFIFTRCPGQCPLVTMKMSGLQKLLPEKILFTTFSVDPEHDTPEALTAYAKDYGAQDGRWFFFTGDKDKTNRLLANLHLGKVDDPNAHSLRFILIDQDARIRGYYDSTDNESVKKLVADARSLLLGRSA